MRGWGLGMKEGVGGKLGRRASGAKITLPVELIALCDCTRFLPLHAFVARCAARRLISLTSLNEIVVKTPLVLKL